MIFVLIAMAIIPSIPIIGAFLIAYVLIGWAICLGLCGPRWVVSMGRACPWGSMAGVELLVYLWPVWLAIYIRAFLER